MQIASVAYALGFGCIGGEMLDTSYLKYYLHLLGITPNSNGYHYFVDALSMAEEDPWKLTLITKLIYPEIAKNHKTSISAVEKSLRSVKNHMWETDKCLVCKICQMNFSQRPTVSTLLACLTTSPYIFPQKYNVIGVKILKDNSDNVNGE